MKQLTFENLVTEEKETPEIIPIRADGLQPRKLEELLPNADILVDTYLIYPDGGYHPFYGVPNTFPIYQQKIWPFVKRIKFSEKYLSQKAVDNVRRGNLRKNHGIEQVNCYWDNTYFVVTLAQNKHYKCDITNKKEFCRKKITKHKLVALAFIPNPNPEKFNIVMHINDDPTNYLRENLKWGTQSENCRGSLHRRPDTMEQKYLALVDRGLIKG